MSNENDAPKEVKAERETPKAKDSCNAKAEASAGLSDLGKKIKDYRKQQHESGKSNSTKDGFPSAKAILGDHAHGESKSKPETTLKTRDASEKGDAAASRDKPNSYEKATNTLLETACQRFGKDKIESMHIKKDDMSTALSALVLGPDVCKALGPEATANFGKRLLVFGIAPALGMADEAQKQFSKQNINNTVIDGGANFLTGTAIGAVLERANPLVMGGAMVGGGVMFANDQLNSPDHRARNSKISHIAGKVDGANNDDLINYAEQTRHLIGPDAYKGVFVVATGGIGIPEGQALKTEATQVFKASIKDEATQAIKPGAKEEIANVFSKVDLKEVVNNVKNMGKQAFDSIAAVFKEHSGSGAPDSVEQKLAEQIRSKAEAAEKTVTKDICGLADRIGGTMQGLDYRLKSVESMTRKIRDEGESKINDALRYTTMFNTAKLAPGANQIMQELESMGYEKIRVKNTFRQDESYIGINTTFKKDGQLFELQFHTPESINVKENLNHKLYEVARELSFVSNPENGTVSYKPPEELEKVMQKYGEWLDKNYPHIGALGHMLLDDIKSGRGDPHSIDEALEWQMQKHNATIPIPKDAQEVKIFKR